MSRRFSRLSTLVVAASLAAPIMAAPAETGSEEAPYLFAIAQALRYESDYRGARTAFAEAVAADPDEPYLRLEYAEFLYQLGDLKDAEENAAAALRLAPANHEALRLLARISLRQAEGSSQAVERALSYFAELRQRLPNDIDSRVNSGRLLLSLARFDEAADVLREAYELGAKDIRVASHLVAALQGSDNQEQAESSFRELLSDYPGLLEARLAFANLLAEQGRHGDSTAILKASPPEQRQRVEVLRLLALELYRTGQWQEALDTSEAWLKQQPDEVPAQYMRALALSALGRDAEAESALRTLPSDRSQGFDVARVLSQVVERQGRAEEAGNILAEAATQLDERGETDQALRLRLELVDLELRAENWPRVIELTESLLSAAPAGSRSEIEMIRGQALLEAGRGDEAVEVFSRLSADPAVSDTARVREAEALFRVGERALAESKLMELAAAGELNQLVLVARTFHRLEEYELAVPLWVRAKERDDEALEIRFWLASAYERSGRRESAIREFQELLAEDELFAPALNYLGYMWAEKGENLPQAVDLVSRAVALEPNNGAYVDSLGWAYFQMGEYEEARGHLEKAARLVGDDAVVLEHLGDLYLALGQRSLAAESYRRALSLSDDNADQLRRKLEELGGGS